MIEVCSVADYHLGVVVPEAYSPTVQAPPPRPRVYVAIGATATVDLAVVVNVSAATEEIRLSM